MSTCSRYDLLGLDTKHAHDFTQIRCLVTFSAHACFYFSAAVDRAD